MKQISFFLFCIISLSVLNCISPSSANPFFTFTDFYDFLNQYQTVSEGEKPNIINDYITWQTTAKNGFPAIINATHVVFIYYNSTHYITSCEVSLDIYDWFNFTMNQLEINVSFFYLAFTLRPLTRTNYLFVIDGKETFDPRNQYRIKEGFEFVCSELALPSFEREFYYIYRPNIPHGSVTPLTNFSTDPFVQIYLPPDYNTSFDYPVIYFADGSLYTEIMNTTTILDNLIFDDKLIPLIAVFTDPQGFDPEHPLEYDWSLRSSFYSSKSSYLTHLDDLVSYIDNHYSTIDSPFARLHVGLSLTGYVSTIVGLERATTFKNIAIQSMAFWVEDIPTTYNDANPSLDLNFWICVGTYEIWGVIHNRTTDTEEISQFFTDKGWDVSFHYYPEAHSFAFWQHTMDELLIHFFPKSWTSPSIKARTSSWSILLLIISLIVITPRKKTQ
ncbi:MAG: alpha/beta hydrolase [Candidatus Hodarchaeales archaeon]|jgi:enterochelin esterase-like enzyme